MMDITEILESEVGVYCWRVRDCCTTAAKVVSFGLGREVNCYHVWHAMSETAAVGLANKRYGGVSMGHEMVLRGENPELICGELEPEPGDIVALGRDYIGFIARDYRCLTWVPRGLKDAGMTIGRVIRCPRF